MMPVEFVCKIKFSEEEEKRRSRSAGGERASLLEESCRAPVKDLAGFASSCSLHGMKHVFGAAGGGGGGGGCARRALWAAALLASLALFLHQASQCAVAYLQRAHVTALREEATRELLFPAVTICNTNRFRFSALTDADIYHLANLTGLPPKNPEGHRAADLQYPEPDMQDIFNRTGHQLEDMLKSCNFSGHNCSARDFSVIQDEMIEDLTKQQNETFTIKPHHTGDLPARFYTVHCMAKVYTRYGKCYTFNGNKTTSKKTKQGGMGNGLEIMLDIQQDEYLPIWRETNETSLEAGIRVQIHSQDEPPYIHQLGFGVSPGFQTFVSCQEQRLTYLPQPWGNCRSSTDPSIPGYDSYSISACNLHCETQLVLQECQCRMVHMPGNTEICAPDKLKCVDRALGYLRIDGSCRLVGAGFLDQGWNLVSKNSGSSEVKTLNHMLKGIENFLILDIFFEALNYETIEQKKAYDVAGLLGDIGGQMGLFIGASILTILEILDYIYEVIKFRLQRLLRPQKEEKRPQQQSSTVATVNLQDTKTKDISEHMERNTEGATFTKTFLPNNHHHLHHHHLRHQNEDFAC
ncbi:acid-sensing ion channel 4 [Silurus asotus]|uniref:Acid-sensing ion channel 4 n=1 Tax=Silurus asotus TaxID=30991 RepID=A0AAD5B2H6_SILAS|nr:acid-sensing ion channel 4 [Silurus asotus]